MQDYSQFDVIVITILLISSTIGFFKGSIRGILSALKWYGAFLISIAFYPTAIQIVETILQPSPVNNIIAVILVYITALIVISIIIGVILRALGGTVGGTLDRLLGAGIGFAVAYFIVSSVHLAVEKMNGGNAPDFLQNGKTYNFTKTGSELASNLIGNNFTDMLSSLDFTDGTSDNNSYGSGVSGGAPKTNYQNDDDNASLSEISKYIDPSLSNLDNLNQLLQTGIIDDNFIKSAASNLQGQGLSNEQISGQVIQQFLQQMQKIQGEISPSN